MAFPQVIGFGGTNSGGSVLQTDVTLTAAASVEGDLTPSAGDLVIIAIAKDGTDAFGWPPSPAFSVLSPLPVTFTAAHLDVRYRVWQGGDSTTVTITHAAEATAWQAWRITGYQGTPEANEVGHGSADPNPDPPSLTPSWWVAQNLILAIAANDNGAVAITAGPTSPGTWTSFRNDRWNAAGGCGIASARSQNETDSTINPDAFTMAAEQWAAVTIAIRPVATTDLELVIPCATADCLAPVPAVTTIKELAIPPATALLEFLLTNGGSITIDLGLVAATATATAPGPQYTVTTETFREINVPPATMGG